MKSVPIPGEILRTDVFLGLTFDELVVLGAVPIVVVFPTLYIEQIPLIASLALIGVSALGVVAVVVQTPEGQTPLEWAPNALKRRVMPTTYYLKPKEPARATSYYMDRVHTAETVAEEFRVAAGEDADASGADGDPTSPEADPSADAPEAEAGPDAPETGPDADPDVSQTDPNVDELLTDGGVEGSLDEPDDVDAGEAADDAGGDGPDEDELRAAVESAFEGVSPAGGDEQSSDPGGPASSGADATPDAATSADDEGSDADETQSDGTGTIAASDVGRSGAEDDEVVQSVPSDAHMTARQSPQRTDETEQSAFSIPNYTQDLVNVEFVLDRGDEYVPSGVDGAGMVVVDEDAYVGIARVQARTWSIHTERKKSEIVSGYKAGFLSTLDFPVQIVSYPTQFDISDHVARLEEVLEEDRTGDQDSLLVSKGRRLYPNWLQEFIASNDMKQRQFYVAVPLTADQLSQFENENTGLADSLAEKAPPLAPLFDLFSGDDGNVEVSRQQCLRELDGRLRRIANGLRRLDVSVERLDDRDEVLGVLYHYYNNEKPISDAFPTGPYSVEDADAPTPGDDQGGV